MIGRRVLLGGAAATGVAGLAAGYATLIEPLHRLSVLRHSVRPPGWPQGLTLRVAALSDLHAGAPLLDEARIEAIVAAANALDPDVTVLLGDYGPASRFVSRVLPHADVARRLAALRARHGVFAISGNHDWWEDADARRRGMPAIGRALDAAGIAMLGNASLRAGPVTVAGVHSTWAFGAGVGAHDLDAALSGASGPVLLLAHEPDLFPEVPRGVALTLSGHTHGGQLRVLGWSPVVPSRFGNRYAWGHVEESGRNLVVSGGLGTARVPVRFGVPPEITLVTLSA
jgi:predicted MPP superfamily phosphohydrolase